MPDPFRLTEPAAIPAPAGFPSPRARGDLSGEGGDLSGDGMAADDVDLLGRLFAAIGRLREAGDPEELLASVPAELCRVGRFDRVMLSRIVGSSVLPLAVRVADGVDQRRSAELRALVGGQPIRLTSSMLETEVVRKRSTALVARRDPRALSPLVAALGDTRYLVAPIVVDDAVVALVHADNHASRHPLTELDRDLLRTFVDAVGPACESLSILDRLAAQREQLDAALAAAGTLFSPLHVAASSLSPGPVPAVEPSDRPAPRFGAPDAVRRWRFTEREREVLELLVMGATNGQIAGRLVVSESTVKSHVKHIFRKLGVTTRAEAIARYLRSAPPGERRAS